MSHPAFLLEWQELSSSHMERTEVLDLSNGRLFRTTVWGQWDNAAGVRILMSVALCFVPNETGARS
jgi:hypothetical protein